MFGSKAIYEFASLAEGIGNQNRAGKFCGEARYAERQFAELPFDFALYLPGKGGRRGDEETCRIPCVFGLCQEVSGNPARVAFCRQDNRFGWPGGQINRAISAMPSRPAAASNSGFGPGQTATTRETPATRAGTAVMTSVETREKWPPGI